MIAADTNVWIAYFSGEKNRNTDLLDHYNTQELVVLPPVVLTELLSAKGSTQELRIALQNFPIIEPDPQFWIRSAHLRKTLLNKGLKAALADTFIAQSCIDAKVPFITFDKDFRHYSSFGLKLI